ncbi:ribosome silencing factor [bacterium]|nr:ribosome silencing factor [bacterium]
MKRKLKKIIKVIEDKKGINLIVLDVRKLTWICDYFVIVSGETTIQTKTIAENILEKIEEIPVSIEGMEEGKWILIDYGEIIIHIFLPEIRNYYNLEKLWGDAEIVKV